jgi:hypothetical protein
VIPFQIRKKTNMSPYTLDQLATAWMKRRRSVPAAMPVGSIFAILIKSRKFLNKNGLYRYEP